MTQRDHDFRPALPSPDPAAVPTKAPESHVAPSQAETEAPDGLASHFVRRTDNDFHGIKDPSLIGQDIGDDLFDENGDPIED